MNPVSVGQCRSVNKRLSRLAYDKILLRKFPHVIVNGEVYFKEEAYLSDGIFLELMRNDTNDLSWLVHRTTDIMRECQMDSTSWGLLIIAAQDVARDAAEYAERDASWNGVRYAAYSAAYDVIDGCGGLYADINDMYSAFDDACDAAWDVWIASVTTGDDIVELVKLIGITDRQSADAKYFQIAECKSLLAINLELCLKIMAIADQHDLPKSIHIPRDILVELADSPWIQQYVELYVP